MAGINLRVTVDDHGTRVRLGDFGRKVADTLSLMKNIAEVAVASVQETFEAGGRPRWKPLAPSTIKKKGHARPLISSGQLRNVTRKITPTTVVIGVQPSARAYAAIQQLGGKAGRNLSVTIPARPYMVLQPEDETEIEELAERHVAQSREQV